MQNDTKYISHYITERGTVIDTEVRLWNINQSIQLDIVYLKYYCILSRKFNKLLSQKRSLIKVVFYGMADFKYILKIARTLSKNIIIKRNVV